MTDEKLIYDFLYKNFTPIFIDNKIGVHDKIYNRRLSSDEFSLMFSYIFCGYTNNDNETPYDIGAKWFYIEKKKLLVKLDAFLDKCDVILSDTQWDIIDSEGKEITDKDILEIFKLEYDSDFILSYIDNWLSDKIIDFSEKLMRKW